MAINSHHRTILTINRHNHKIMINRMIYIKTIHRHNRKDRILTAVMNHRINLTKIHSHQPDNGNLSHEPNGGNNQSPDFNEPTGPNNSNDFGGSKNDIPPEQNDGNAFYRHRVNRMETVKIQCHILTENNLKCRNKKFLHFL